MVYHSGMRAEVSPTPAFRSEADRVAAVVRDQIVTGARPAGARLVERDLAAELDVSRVPVRDALRTLVSEGLVTPRPHTWAVVRTFTAADVDDLIEVRSALETLTFRHAALRRSPEQLDALRSHVADERRAAETGDAVSARRAGAAFHEEVVAAAGNVLLAEIFAATRSRMLWLLGQHTALAEMADEHDALCTAVADGDADRAETLARGHLEVSRAAAMAGLAAPAVSAVSASA